MIKRTRLIYGALATVWVLLLVWQVAEHRAVRENERFQLIKSAKGMTSVLGSEMRLIRFFNGLIPRERLLPVLKDIVERGELQAVAILNKDGTKVISAGPDIDLESKDILTTGELWGEKSVTVVANVLDLLGTNFTGFEGAVNFIVSRAELDGINTNSASAGTNGPLSFRPETPPPARDEMPPARPEDHALTNDFASSNLLAEAPRPGPPGPDRARRGGFGRNRMGRPPWMSEEEFQRRIQEKGAHAFVVVMSTQSMREAENRDLWMRVVICMLGTVAVMGSGVAWRNMLLSGELEVRLVRASELNARLKEMNLAAAGLAHETRNPLNIIRGLAQMISKQQDASLEVRSKTREILDEADRVTAQLNEFINYSRPREVRRTNVPLGSVVGEVVRALNFDIEEKVLRVEVQPNLPTISADEQLLRQALFNLLLNATQAVERGGEIHVSAQKINGSQIILEIRDNGPGVAPEQRKEIFKPYFTTNQKGTGLGLAVVQQIVMAHGWEIECQGNEPRGALFLISHIKIAAP